MASGCPLQCLHISLASGPTVTCCVCVSSAVFGRSLSETIAHEQRFGPRLVPILVQKCADFIREHGLNEEGIFRLPGQDNQVKQFRDAFDAGERPSFPR